jgi:EAL domain-containing protein (putative c-di-GMP-specific phosphodiesterase class I)
MVASTERHARSQQAPELESLTGILRTWRRHLDEVGTIQQSLPRAAKDRIDSLAIDLDTALAQTRHLFALEFAPQAVTALAARLDEALGAIEALAPAARSGPGRNGTADRRRALEANRLAMSVRSVIAASDALEMHLQPIVELSGPRHTPVGFEALARFVTSPYEPPNVWLDRAAQAGLQHELELSCVRGALVHLAALPPTAYLAINVAPETLVSAEFERIVSDLPVERIVVEVTEHAAVREYDSLLHAIGGLRARGLRLAVDDAGAGFASFRHVLELNPDVIKLDIHLTRGISRDRSREALVRSLVSFADDVGATLIAEGIESQEDLMTLRDARVHYGQGFLFAEPGPAPVILRRRRPTRAVAGASVRSA